MSAVYQTEIAAGFTAVRFLPRTITACARTVNVG
jgi:hypothetical protein